MAGAKEVEGDRNIKVKKKVNPFLEPSILEVLFKQLSTEDLARCRLVNKLWCNESLSTWRSNNTLKFETKGLISTEDDGYKRRTSLGEFLDLWDAGDWASRPFRNFDLQNWHFNPGDLKQRNQERFMKLVGSHVTSLVLTNCSFVGRDNFRRIIYQAFPKLQFLKMDQCKVDGNDWYKLKDENRAYKEPAFGVHRLESLDISNCRPHSLMDILSHFHKIKSLHLRTPGLLAIDIDLNQAEYRNLLETIRLIRAQDQTKLPLTNFDVYFSFKLGQSTAYHVEMLKLQERLKLPVYRFEIHFDHEGNMDCNEDVIRDILQCHSSTVKYLEFSGGEGDGLHMLSKLFPFGFYPDNLEKLVINSMRSPRYSYNLNYLRYIPNLRVLEIQDFSFRVSMSKSDDLFFNTSELEIEDRILSSLTDLTICLPLSVCNLRKLMKWIPNVERLSGLELDDVKFSLVCKNWKNLMELQDCGEELTDEGVIGIGIGNANEADEDEETQSCPNITNLKNLTSFETYSSKLTSASVHEGFLKLANLKRISLGGSTKLDDETKAALTRNKIKLD